MSEFVKITGLDQIKAAFARLPVDVGRNVLKKGSNAGALVFRDAARSLVPVRTGRLRAAIIAKYVREDSNDTQAVSIVTVRHGKKLQRTNRDAFYGRFVEFGHRTRGDTYVQGQRFLTRAFNANVARDINVIVDVLSSELNKLPEFR